MSVGLAKYRIRLTVKRTNQKAFILSTLDSYRRLEELLQPLRIFVPKEGNIYKYFATIKPVHAADASIAFQELEHPCFYVLLLLSFRFEAFSSFTFPPVKFLHTFFATCSHQIAKFQLVLRIVTFSLNRTVGVYVKGDDYQRYKDEKGGETRFQSLSISLWSIHRVDTYADSISLVVILSWLTKEKDKEKPASNLNLKEATDKALMSSLNVRAIFVRNE